MTSSRPLTVCLVSLGCPKNLVDSEKMLALLGERGCIVGAPMDDADVIVVNTCGFLSAARDESLEVIAEALSHKASGRTRRVVVAGCLVNRDARKLYELAPGIDAIVGVDDRGQIAAAVTGRRRATRLTRCTGRIASDAGRFRLTPRHTAYLRVSQGCSQQCTFCTIPALRGPFRSKPPQAVLHEARELIADGAVELNLIGQDTTSYGRDLGGRVGPASLLRSLDRLDGVRWIRLLYAYPRRFSDALIGAMAESPRVAPYVDLPLQHVCDPVLRRMGRRVRRKGIEGLLARLRRRVEGVAIRTTFIVGFPGERDEHFEELLEFVREFRFDAVGVFAFSPEPPTPAASMDGAVPDDVKADRAEAIMLAQQEIVFQANRRMIGRPIEVLVDGVDAAGRCVGRHRGQAPDVDSICYLTGTKPPGTFVEGKVAGAEDYDLIVDCVSSIGERKSP